MKLRKLIHPVLALTVGAMLYTGCNPESDTYIFAQPSAIAYVGLFPVPDGGAVSLESLHFEVSIPTQLVHFASAATLPGNLAYATSIYQPPPVLLEKIKDIRIRPLTAYNSKYAALDDMSDAVGFTIHTRPNDTVSKDVFLMGNNNAISGLSDVSLHFQLWLKEPPSDGGAVKQFIIEIITDTNSKLADTTQSFILNL